MCISILKEYIELCQGLGIDPSFEGLNQYKEGLKNGVLIVG